MPTGSTSQDSESGMMMAMLERRSGVNVLRPSPQTARLAYMLLAADLGDSNVTDT